MRTPGAPETLRPQGAAPNISVSVGVQPRPVSDTDIEVELRLEARAVDGETTLFAIELVYAGVFRLINVTQETINPIMLIECPRLLFPFARKIIARRQPEWRLSAAAARPDRFRRALPAAHGQSAGRPAHATPAAGN